MGAPRGHKKHGGGSRKGKKNKFTIAAKEAFQKAFDEIGGYKALAEWAKENKTEYYKLYSKLIPIDVQSGGESLRGGLIIINGKTVTEA